MMAAMFRKSTPKPEEIRKSSGFGLDSIGDLSGLLDTPETVSNVSTGPIELPLDLIDEDLNQPRKADNPGFLPESIAEIGATIKERGVKSPISVRENLEIQGRYIINHGARRYRGAKWAGKESIPAFIDNDYNETDQVIENLQRNELTAREIADFIGRELAKNKKKSDIAKEIGKSPAFITQHITLLDLPEPIADVFNTGRVRDVTVVNELVTAYKKKPSEVGTWLKDEDQEITRGSVKLLREFLEEKMDQKETIDAEPEGNDAQQWVDNDSDANGKVVKAAKEVDPNKLKKAIVQVEYYGRPARLVLTKRASEVGRAWLKYEDDGNEFEASIKEVNLVAIVEG
ncbi:chromosome partitioning protein ParB (plasmid) [Xylella fastidiosa]|nr:chromosome partitioning protein ParB [Xylella fastidiosa]